MRIGSVLPVYNNGVSYVVCSGRLRVLSVYDICRSMSTEWFHIPQQNLSQCCLVFTDGFCVVYVSGNYCRLMHLYFRSGNLLFWRKVMFPPGKCCILINGCFGMKPIF